jgi:hypothetical protein
MIDDARDRPVEVNSIDRKRARAAPRHAAVSISFAGPTEKRIRRHFPGVLTNDRTYLSDFAV